MTDTEDTAKAPASESKSGGPTSPKQRQWHRRPGKKIDDLLLKRHQRYAPLSRLIDLSEQRKSLTQAVRSLLPESLAAAVSVALHNLADFQDLTKINLRVVQTGAQESVEKPRRYIPDAAANSLTQLANSLAEQPDYRELLNTILRLSEHTQESGKESDGARSTP